MTTVIDDVRDVSSARRDNERRSERDPRARRRRDEDVFFRFDFHELVLSEQLPVFASSRVTMKNPNSDCIATPLGVTVPGARPRARSAAMYDEPDVRYGVKRESQAKNVLLCKTELGKVRIERRDWWLISPVTTTPATVTTPNRRRPVLSPPSFAS